MNPDIIPPELIGQTMILDASAVLALLAGEPGSELVATILKNRCLMSSVNAAEVAAKLSEADVPENEIAHLFERLLIEVIPFERVDALRAGRMRPETRSYGLSLGDRACLATAERLSLPVLTADSAWASCSTSVVVHLVR